MSFKSAETLYHTWAVKCFYEILEGNTVSCDCQTDSHSIELVAGMLVTKSIKN